MPSVPLGVVTSTCRRRRTDRVPLWSGASTQPCPEPLPAGQSDPRVSARGSCRGPLENCSPPGLSGTAAPESTCSEPVWQFGAHGRGALCVQNQSAREPQKMKPVSSVQLSEPLWFKSFSLADGRARGGRAAGNGPTSPASPAIKGRQPQGHRTGDRDGRVHTGGLPAATLGRGGCPGGSGTPAVFSWAC